jgi:hypothetical protein
VFQRFQICFQIYFTITRFFSSRTTSFTIFSIHDKIKKNWSRESPQILTLLLIFDAEHYPIIFFQNSKISSWKNFFWNQPVYFSTGSTTDKFATTINFFKDIYDNCATTSYLLHTEQKFSSTCVRYGYIEKYTVNFQKKIFWFNKLVSTQIKYILFSIKVNRKMSVVSIARVRIPQFLYSTPYWPWSADITHQSILAPKPFFISKTITKTTLVRF